MNLTINGATTESSAATVGELLGPLPPGYAVALNGEVVPRGEHGSRVLADGDVVEVVTAVAGG